MRRLRAMFGRQTKVWLLVLVFSVAGFSARAPAELLCSAGSNDGNTCQTHADCPGGACVYVQGVCNDQNGLLCDCPSSTCSAQPACSTDSSMGTCSGGVFAGVCCDTTYNCDSGVACQESQKVCVGGSTSGYPCLNDQQCNSSQCRSTGLVCEEGTDYAGDSCAQDSDCCVQPTTCAVGACFSPATVLTPTATASRTGAAVTPTPSPSVRASVTATVAASPTAQTVTPRPRPTQAPAQLYEAIGEGAGCTTVGDGGWSFAMLAGVVVLWAARRRPGARQHLD
ncbi:MAG: hypothetical protein ABSA52_03375 [Candidatus Binatia bacterium]|jgi:hypothetical protein